MPAGPGGPSVQYPFRVAVWTLSATPDYRLIHLNRNTAVVLVEYAHVLVEIDATLHPPRTYSLSVNKGFAGRGSVMDNEVSIFQSKL